MAGVTIAAIRSSGHFLRGFSKLVTSAGRVSRLLRQESGGHVCRRCDVTAVSPAEGTMRSPYRDVFIPDTVNLAHYVMEDFSMFGDSEALVDGVSGQVVTFAQLQSYVRRAASALVRMGLESSDVITIYSPNLPEYAVMYLAVVAMGGVVSTINPLYTQGELHRALDQTKSRLVVTVPSLVPVVKAVTKDNTHLKGVVVFGRAAGCRSYWELLEDDGGACPASLPAIPRRDTAALLFSSDTTGLPKPVMLSHYNIIANIQQSACTDEMVRCERGRDRLLGLLPFFHVFGQVAVMLAGLRNGVKMVTMPKFDPELFLQIMQGHRITTVHVAPPVVVFLAKHPYVEMYNLRHMTTMICGAAPVPSQVVEQMVDRLKLPNFKFRQGFGMTEASSITHINPRVGSKYDSIGLPVHNTEFKIIDPESGAAVGEGRKGELVVRGPQIMKGYLDDPQATADVIDAGGWLHTGDLAHYDADGHVFITDRLKDVIKHKGLQVAPAELESLLLTHPAVVDAAVIGIPDDRDGELPRAFIKLRPNTKVTGEEIQDFVKGKVASYKELSGGVAFRSDIPKNQSGNPLRRQLRQEYLTQQ